jgi:hypothetical protein
MILSVRHCFIFHLWYTLDIVRYIGDIAREWHLAEANYG